MDFEKNMDREGEYCAKAQKNPPEYVSGGLKAMISLFLWSLR